MSHQSIRLIPSAASTTVAVYLLRRSKELEAGPVTENAFRLEMHVKIREVYSITVEVFRDATEQTNLKVFTAKLWGLRGAIIKKLLDAHITHRLAPGYIDQLQEVDALIDLLPTEE